MNICGKGHGGTFESDENVLILTWEVATRVYTYSVYVSDSSIKEIEKKRERERKVGEREILICLFHLFTHSVVDSCTCLDREQTCNLGVSGRCSNQLSYPARVSYGVF